MENQSHHDKFEEMKHVKCRVCGKVAQTSASSSNHDQDVSNCHCSSGHTTENSTSPKTVKGVTSRPCKHARAGCTKLIVSTKIDHESICDYRNTTCMNENCMRPILIKDLLPHLLINHELVTGDKLVLTWPIPQNDQQIAVPLYAFDCIIWQLIIFKNNAISIAFYYESPNNLTPKLLVSLCIRAHDVQFANTVRVLNKDVDPSGDVFTLPYSKIQLYWAMLSAYGDRQTTVMQGLHITRDTS